MVSEQTRHCICRHTSHMHKSRQFITQVSIDSLSGPTAPHIELARLPPAYTVAASCLLSATLRGTSCSSNRSGCFLGCLEQAWNTELSISTSATPRLGDCAAYHFAGSQSLRVTVSAPIASAVRSAILPLRRGRA
jgi:hypothetical protein